MDGFFTIYNISIGIIKEIRILYEFVEFFIQTYRLFREI